MDAALRRRLDALLVVASALVGVEVADLFATGDGSLLTFAVIPAVLAVVLSLSYVYADDTVV